MFQKSPAICPVCGTALGFLLKGQICAFVCRECHWVFTWDQQGKLGKPIKVNAKKPDVCDCGSCQYRNEKKYLSQ